MAQATTWRQILKTHSASFLSWLTQVDREYTSIDSLAGHLTSYLISRIGTGSDARAFWEAIPQVRAACNDPNTYGIPWAAEAYAYVHLLERYRRTWAVLKHLTEMAVLPLGSRGTRVLDIGAGPASALYAIDDFFSGLCDFAHDSQIEELHTPPPILDSVENSFAMARFMHYFSEHCGRRGPFGPTIVDFSGLDFAAEREFHFRNYDYETYWDPDTNSYEEWYDPTSAVEESSRLFRYRLVVVSNFLTLASTVSSFETELRNLFNDLNAGSIVVVLGGTGNEYQDVYEKLAKIAEDASLALDQWDSDELGKSADSRFSDRIKLAQFTVYQHLSGLVDESELSHAAAWPDYWDQHSLQKARSKFALRVFRAGRWPRPN